MHTTCCAHCTAYIHIASLVSAIQASLSSLYKIKYMPCAYYIAIHTVLCHSFSFVRSLSLSLCLHHRIYKTYYEVNFYLELAKGQLGFELWKLAKAVWIFDISNFELWIVLDFHVNFIRKFIGCLATHEFAYGFPFSRLTSLANMKNTVLMMRNPQ